jgi:hypothetical protein
MTPAEIAAKLGRTEETVRQWFITVLHKSPDEDTPQEEVERRLFEKTVQHSPEWEALKSEFDEDELKFFKHLYAKLMVQFKEDVKATEETQIFTLIKYEILKHRNLVAVKESREKVTQLEDMVKQIHENYPDGPATMSDTDKSFLMNCQNQILSAQTADKANSNEYNHLTAKANALLKELKATRDQRISRLEQEGTTVLDLFKKLMDEDFRASEGRMQALATKATLKEKERFAELHTFVDGTLDQPLLTPETVS